MWPRGKLWAVVTAVKSLENFSVSVDHDLFPRIVTTAISRPASLWLAGCLCYCAGCGPTPPQQTAPPVQVRGKVTYQGKPVPGAQLTFHREFDDEREGAFAVTDARGEFHGATNDTTGILPGEYHVTVFHPRMNLPNRYADVESSPLKLTIIGEQSELEFPVELAD